MELNIRRGTTNEEGFLAFVNEKLLPNLQRFDGINPHSVVVIMLQFTAFKMLNYIIFQFMSK